MALSFPHRSGRLRFRPCRVADRAEGSSRAANVPVLSGVLAAVLRKPNRLEWEVKEVSEVGQPQLALDTVYQECQHHPLVVEA